MIMILIPVIAIFVLVESPEPGWFQYCIHRKFIPDRTLLWDCPRSQTACYRKYETCLSLILVLKNHDNYPEKALNFVWHKYFVQTMLMPQHWLNKCLVLIPIFVLNGAVISSKVTFSYTPATQTWICYVGEMSTVKSCVGFLEETVKQKETEIASWKSRTHRAEEESSKQELALINGYKAEINNLQQQVRAIP